MHADVQEGARAGTAATMPPGGSVTIAATQFALPGLPPECARSTDLAHVLDDVVHLVRCLIALDETETTDRWRREAQGYEALARARRSLHRCARNRGMA